MKKTISRCNQNPQELELQLTIQGLLWWKQRHWILSSDIFVRSLKLNYVTTKSADIFKKHDLEVLPYQNMHTDYFTWAASLMIQPTLIIKTSTVKWKYWMNSTTRALNGKNNLLSAKTTCVIHATLPLFPQPSVFLHQEVQVTIFRYTPAYFCTVPRFMPADFHALAIFQHPTLGKLVGAMFLRSQGCLIKGKIDIELALICATG